MANNDQTMMFDFCDALLGDEYGSDEENGNHTITATDSDTEQEISDEEGLMVTESEKEDTTYTVKDATSIWQTNRIEDTKKPKEPVQSGAKPCAQKAKTELECWNLFFSNDMIENILHHTNVEIKSKTFHDSSPTSKPKNANMRTHIVKETTKEELMALFGLMYIAGINNPTGYNLTDLWRSDGTGVDIFRMTMSLQRFNFLHNCLRFDDASTREERIKFDNLAPVRWIFDTFITNCQNAYTPSQFLTLDQKYVPFRGDCPFRQFMPNTAAAYGIKMYALVDTKEFYTVNLEIYAGDQPDGPYAISNQPADIVERLVKPISKTNRNVTFDNRFTSFPLVQHLLKEHGLTSIGALTKNKTGIPHSFLATRGRTVHSSRFGFHKDMTLVSYMPKKSKVVLLVSSFHHDATMDLKIAEKPKPEMVSFYNSTKTGVQVVDKLIKMFDVRNYCRSWPHIILYTMMNVATINGFIIYRENNNCSRKDRRCEFNRKLGLALLEPHLRLRKDKINLPRELRKRIFEQMGESLTNPPANSTDSKPYKRCRDCPSSKDRKTKYACLECKKPICLQHVVAMCENCISLTIE